MYAIRPPADTAAGIAATGAAPGVGAPAPAGTVPGVGARGRLPGAPEQAPARPILFVDGHCVLCQRTARWVMRRDRRGRVSLAALQGKTARRLLPPALLEGAPAPQRSGIAENAGGPRAQALHGEAGRTEPADTAPAAPGSLVWREVDGRIRIRSAAVLAVAAALGGRYRIGAALLRLVPAPLRDALYLAVARRRRRWFGATDRCLLPAAADRGRLLD